MIIREPGESDAEAIREVKGLAVARLRKVYRPTEAAIARKAARATIRRSLVCERDGQVVAVVEYEDRGDRLHLLGPMVHPDHQRRGLARALVGHIAELARRAGKRALSLNTIKQTGNVAIFARLGFSPIREIFDQGPLAENLTDEDLIDVYMEREIGESGLNE